MGKFISRSLTLLLSTLSLLSLSACGDEGCVEQVTPYVVGLFTQQPENETTITSFSVYGLGQASDSAMVLNQTSLESVDLILNADSVKTRLLFQFILPNTPEPDTLRDTVTVFYTNRDFFINIDCGCSVFHTIDTLTFTKEVIQDIEILNSDVTNEKTPNIKIYY